MEVSWLAGRGSSPRGRGKLRNSLGTLTGMRLIPARAGKTSVISRRSTMPEAHPRAGGENPMRAADTPSLGGSSPRGRGKHSTATKRMTQYRLIPARAGKTGRMCDRCARARAHPRAGGENAPHRSPKGNRPGSSPRGRGKLRCRACCCRFTGLIPARAGKTPWTSSDTRTPSAHPRAGGENRF